MKKSSHAVPVPISASAAAVPTPPSSLPKGFDAHCVWPGFLYLGSARASKHDAGLQAIGCTHIVSLAAKEHFPGRYVFSSHHVPDGNSDQWWAALPGVIQVLASLFIEHQQHQQQQLQSGGGGDKTKGSSCKSRRGPVVVLLHCSGGVSRSPSVALVFLMLSLQLTFEMALAQLSAIRPCIRINQAFVALLKQPDRLQQLATGHHYQPASAAAAAEKGDEPELKLEQQQEEKKEQDGNAKPM